MGIASCSVGLVRSYTWRVIKKTKRPTARAVPMAAPATTIATFASVHRGLGGDTRPAVTRARVLRPPPFLSACAALVFFLLRGAAAGGRPPRCGWDEDEEEDEDEEPSGLSLLHAGFAE